MTSPDNRREGDDAPQLHTELHPFHILVRQSGRLRNLRDARGMQLEIERLIAGTNARRAVFDNRLTLPVQEAVGKSMWQWIHERRPFERLAMILDSVEHARAVNLRSAKSGSLVRAFNDEQAALEWLHAEWWLDANVLVFEFSGVNYAVDAMSVAEVIPWQKPVQMATLPLGAIGMIEHRGRMRMMCTPDAQPLRDEIATSPRIVLFERDWGELAVPADKTHAAGTIQLAMLPAHGLELETNIGRLRFINPRELAAQLRG